MTKNLLFACLMAFSFSLQAQIYTEDFEAGLNTFTTFDNDGDGNEWSTGAVANFDISSAALSNSWLANVVLTPDNLLTSSAIELPAGVPIILEYFVGNVETTNNWWEEYYDVIVTTSNDTEEILAATPVYGEALPSGGSMLERNVVLTDFAGSTVYLTFRHHNCTDENFLVLDDISIKEIPTDDLAITAVNMDPIVLAGEVMLSGSIKNLGANDIVGYDISWDSGSGPVTESFTGTIGSYETVNFTLATPLNAEAGLSYDVDICATAADDLVESNNCIQTEFSCASKQGTRLPFMEVYTSSTCPPCLTLAQTGFGGGGLLQYLKDANANDQTNADLAVISWQVNWPGVGDHAYNEEVGTRRNFYGVNAAPTLLIDAAGGGVPADVASSAAVPAFVDLAATAKITGNDIVVDVTVNPYAAFPGASLVVAILDDGYDAGGADDAFTNGETEFHHVFRKALPSIDGESVDLVGDQEYTSTMNYVSSEVATGFPSQGSFETHISSSREVVVYLQGADGSVLNAAIATLDVVGINELDGSAYSIFPNPTSGMTTIDLGDNKEAFFTLYTLTGQTLVTGTINGKAKVDLSAYDTGFYFVSLKDKQGNIAVSKIQLTK